ncbi:MAG: ATP-binding protein [Williamsia sp.]|nr:ATP-binding protein [Williamsia sp.]
MKKIVIIGPESTGKSTLCSELALHYQTRWVEEYAREYLLKNGTRYSFDDLLVIAKGQLLLEEQGAANLPLHEPSNTATGPLLFIDTDMNVMKVWCEVVFGNCHRFILDQIVQRTYDLYLLCDTDLPWVKDELREYPDLTTRRKLFHMYHDILINQRTPWALISGTYEERLQQGIRAVESTLLAKTGS